MILPRDGFWNRGRAASEDGDDPLGASPHEGPFRHTDAQFFNGCRIEPHRLERDTEIVME
jgi:hypothetical protein